MFNQSCPGMSKIHVTENVTFPSISTTLSKSQINVSLFGTKVEQNDVLHQGTSRSQKSGASSKEKAAERPLPPTQSPFELPREKSGFDQIGPLRQDLYRSENQFSEASQTSHPFTPSLPLLGIRVMDTHSGLTPLGYWSRLVIPSAVGVQETSSLSPWRARPDKGRQDALSIRHFVPNSFYSIHIHFDHITVFQADGSFLAISRLDVPPLPGH